MVPRDAAFILSKSHLDQCKDIDVTVGSVCLYLLHIIFMANIIQCRKPYTIFLVLHNKCLVMMAKQMQLCVVILRKCKEVDQCPHIISTSTTPKALDE